MTPDIKNKILKMKKEGFSQLAIAKELGITLGSVAGVCRRNKGEQFIDVAKHKPCIYKAYVDAIFKERGEKPRRINANRGKTMKDYG